jgi:hypothetical protein
MIEERKTPVETKTYQTYEAATQVYLTRFRALRDAPPSKSRAVTRGAADIPVETLIERADEIADVSARMVPLAKGYLAAPNPTLREGISGQLLAQAAAELQVATELLHIAARESAGPTTPATRAPRGVTRAARGANLRDAIDSMEKVMKMPVSDGLVVPGLVPVRRGGTAAKKPDTPEKAKQALKEAASIAASAISQHVVETGGDLAFNLVFKTEWTAVIQSAGLLSKDIAKLLDQLKKGASELIQRTMTAATKTMLNVFDKILALLGKDIEDQARKQIEKWLEDIQKTGKIELFEQVVGKLYKKDKLEKALPGWMEKTTAGVDKINTTKMDVAALSDKFTALVGHIKTVGDVIGLAKFIQVQFPQVVVISTAIRVALLAVLVYAGYDYIGYDQVNFLNLTKGVTEVIRENLSV